MSDKLTEAQRMTGIDQGKKQRRLAKQSEKSLAIQGTESWLLWPGCGKCRGMGGGEEDRGGEGHVKHAKGFKREVTPLDLNINVHFS